MTRRKRSKQQRDKDDTMAAPKSGLTRGKTEDGIPIERLKEIAKTHTVVNAKICRRNEKGTLQTIYGKIELQMDTFPYIEDWLKDKAGGGRYEIEVYDVNDAYNKLVPRFTVYVEGRPRPVQDLSSPSGVGPGSHTQPRYRDVPQSFASGVSGGVAPPPQSPYGPPAPGATVASDQLAMQQLGELKAELEKQQMRYEKDREALEEKLKRVEQERDRERSRAIESRYESRMESMQAQFMAQIESLKAAREAPAVQQDKSEMWVKGMAALAPVLATYITSSKESNVQSMKMQQDNMQAMMTAIMGQASKPDQMIETVKTLAPAIMPFVMKMLEQRGPEAQTAMFEAMANQNLNNVSMMAQLMEAIFQSNASEEQQAWLPVVRQLLAGGVEIFEAYMNSQTGLPGQQLPPPEGPIGYPPQQQRSAAPMAVRQAEQSKGFTTIEPKEETPSAETADEGGRIIDMPKRPSPIAPLGVIFQLMPMEFQTMEWKTLLREIHEEDPPPVEEMAEKILGHIQHLEDFDALPHQIEDFFEAPRDRLTAILERLPVWRANGDYAVALIDAVVERITYEDDDDAEEEGTDELEAQDAAAEAQEDDLVEEASFETFTAEPPKIAAETREPAPAE